MSGEWGTSWSQHMQLTGGSAFPAFPIQSPCAKSQFHSLHYRDPPRYWLDLNNENAASKWERGWIGCLFNQNRGGESCSSYIIGSKLKWALLAGCGDTGLLVSATWVNRQEACKCKASRGSLVRTISKWKIQMDSGQVWLSSIPTARNPKQTPNMCVYKINYSCICFNYRMLQVFLKISCNNNEPMQKFWYTYQYFPWKPEVRTPNIQDGPNLKAYQAGKKSPASTMKPRSNVG